MAAKKIDEIVPPKLKKDSDKGMLSGFERARGVMGEHYDNYVILAKLPDGGFQYCAHGRIWAEGASRKFLRIIEEEDKIGGRYA